MNDLERCEVEQQKAADYIRSGGSDQFNARLGLQDWVKEEILIREENATRN